MHYRKNIGLRVTKRFWALNYFNQLVSVNARLVRKIEENSRYLTKRINKQVALATSLLIVC